MNEIWCFGSHGITCEVHPTAQIYVGTGVVGQFSYNDLAGIGHIIPIHGQISTNGSVKLLGIPNFRRTSLPMYTDNLLDPHDTTCLGDGGNYNQNWGVHPGGPYSNVATSCGTTVPDSTTYMPRTLENPRATACCCTMHL